MPGLGRRRGPIPPADCCRRASASGRRDRDFAAMGVRGSRAGRLLPWCRSRSAPASRIISPPIMSRCCRPRRSPPSRYAQRRCCCGGTNVSGCGDDRGRRRRLCDCDLEDARIARCVLARPMLSVKPTRWCRVLHCRTQRSSRFLKDLVERPIAGL